MLLFTRKSVETNARWHSASGELRLYTRSADREFLIVTGCFATSEWWAIKSSIPLYTAWHGLASFAFTRCKGVKRLGTKLNYCSLRNASGLGQGRGGNPQCICSAVSWRFSITWFWLDIMVATFISIGQIFVNCSKKTWFLQLEFWFRQDLLCYQLCYLYSVQYNHDRGVWILHQVPLVLHSQYKLPIR